MPSDKYKHYISDLGAVLKQKAREAKTATEAAQDVGQADYELGTLMAYHEVISLMQQEADSFGIDRAVVGLDDIDPETDLL